MNKWRHICRDDRGCQEIEYSMEESATAQVI